jgi:hypothetical protein
VVGAPRPWLRIEGLTLLVGALVAYSTTGRRWWVVPIARFQPDVAMAGYLGGTPAGAHLYNLAHSTPVPAVAVGLGWGRGAPLVAALGLVWLARIGLDRLVAYGLKYDDHFQHRHLGWMGGRHDH